MDRDPQQERALRVALLGDREELYYRSPTFHDAIETLASWLPLWVDAMATEAVKADEDMRQRTEDAERLLGQGGQTMVLGYDPASSGSPGAAVLLLRDERGHVTIARDSVGQPVTGADAQAVADFAARLRRPDVVVPDASNMERALRDMAEPHRYVGPDADGAPCCPERWDAAVHTVAARTQPWGTGSRVAGTPHPYQHNAGYPSGAWCAVASCGQNAWADVHQRPSTILPPPPAPVDAQVLCPDEGTCHHDCPMPGVCWRVMHAAPLAAAGYPGDRWPQEIVDDHTPDAACTCGPHGRSVICPAHGDPI